MSSVSFTLNDGTIVPGIGFGTGTALFGKDCAGQVKQAIDAGFVHLDGAQAYNNEESLSEGIKLSGKPRSELFIVTKLRPGALAEHVKPAFDASLKKLGVDFVDLFLVHCPIAMKAGDPQPDLPEVWHEVEAIHAQGLAKSIGVSNFRIPHLQAILPTAKVIPSVNQLEIHPYVWKTVEPIVKFGVENGNITAASYGGLTPIVRAAGGPLDPVLATVAERLTKEFGKPVSPGQVLSKWVLQKKIILVTTSSKEERLREYLQTAELPDLTEAEIAEIDTVGAKLHKRVFMKHVFDDTDPQ
ncbi:Aldo-ket-red domain-containing protein [Mycena chlorophos]|uniref:Aldo-ket-red domain-containing protein n=1 Tax=Mycena chlorophos TaxID=658473 RepID=A0A8H6WLL8_MYCCL|nr:Aldo-ket-red domain-containing protein [Mycena chlorophos]